MPFCFSVTTLVCSTCDIPGMILNPAATPLWNAGHTNISFGTSTWSSEITEFLQREIRHKNYAHIKLNVFSSLFKCFNYVVGYQLNNNGILRPIRVRWLVQYTVVDQEFHPFFLVTRSSNAEFILSYFSLHFLLELKKTILFPVFQIQADTRTIDRSVIQLRLTFTANF